MIQDISWKNSSKGDNNFYLSEEVLWMDSEISRSQNIKLCYEKCNNENINNAMMMKPTKIKLLHSFKTFKYTSVKCQLLFYYLYQEWKQT